MEVVTWCPNPCGGPILTPARSKVMQVIAADHHRKFHLNRARQLGLVHIATDKQTDRQTDRQTTTTTAPQLIPLTSRVLLLPPLPAPPLLTPGGLVRPRIGGRIPPNPPSLRPWHGTPYNGGKPPQTPQSTVPSRMAIFDTSFPSLRSGTD